MSIVVPDPATTDWVPMGYGASIQANVPTCRVYRTTAQSIPNIAWTALSFDAERWDTDTLHDNATNPSYLTCRTAGKYLVTFTAGFALNATGVRGYCFRVNGGSLQGVAMANAMSGNAHYGGSTLIVDLAVGDFVECLVYQSSGGALTIDPAAMYSPEAQIAYIGPGLLGRGQQNISGTYALRPAATTVPPGTTYYASDCGGLFLSDGLGWTLISQRALQVAPGQMGSPPWSTPYDGMEMILVDGSANPAYEWAMRYNASSSSSFKWEFVGGSPWVIAQNTNQTIGASAWTNLSPGLATFPRSGDYILRAYAQALTPATASTMYLGIYANSVGNNYTSSTFTQQASWWITFNCAIKTLGAASTTGVGLNGYSIVTGATYYAGMFLEMIPVRVT